MGESWLAADATNMSADLDDTGLGRNEALADALETRIDWTSMELDDVMQDVVVDMLQDVMVDKSTGDDAPVHSPLPVEGPRRDAMKQGFAPRTVGGAAQHVVSCHQPPWKLGCSHGIGEIRGGADKHGRRYCYECTSCGDKWNQTRADLLVAGEDPVVRTSNRCTNFSDKRRSNGYKCRACGGKKNAASAAPGGRLCSCPRKTKVQRQTQLHIATPTVPSKPPVAHDKDTPAIFVRAVRKHPRIKPGGVSLRQWRALLAAVEG